MDIVAPQWTAAGARWGRGAPAPPRAESGSATASASATSPRRPTPAATVPGKASTCDAVRNRSPSVRFTLVQFCLESIIIVIIIIIIVILFRGDNGS